MSDNETSRMRSNRTIPYGQTKRLSIASSDKDADSVPDSNTGGVNSGLGCLKIQGCYLIQSMSIHSRVERGMLI